MFKTSIAILLIVACLATPTRAAKIADITRLGGQRTNVLTGMGLVFGLKGTGDGGDFTAAIGPLAAMLSKFNNSVPASELGKVANVAIVNITATIPSTGARNGDKLDVHVHSIGAATSLNGGRLFVCPMTGPAPSAGGIFALAQGPIELEDLSAPTSAIVHGGAVMEVDLPVKTVFNGQFSLILEAPAANWTTASLIAKTINGAEANNGEKVAEAVDFKEVIVTIPQPELEHPDGFISRVQQLPLIMLATEARVTINAKKGTMIVTGDVEISPVVISHKGLTIETTNPPPAPRPGAPVVTQHNAIPMDTANQGGARLQDLVNSMEQLRVPAEDRITIVRELYISGKLHAKLIEESD